MIVMQPFKSMAFNPKKWIHTLSLCSLRLSCSRDVGRPITTLTAATMYAVMSTPNITATSRFKSTKSILLCRRHSYFYTTALRHTTSRWTSSASTSDKQQEALLSFPPDLQRTITAVQEQFNRCVMLSSNGLFELYDEKTTELMWKATSKRSSRMDSTVTISDALTSNDTSVLTTKQAGVLVLLVLQQNDLAIVFTRRSKHLSSHASQISFPGGHYEETKDETIVDTAVREAVEELHATHDDEIFQQFRQNLYVFGCTTPVPSLRGIPVTSVLGIYNNTNTPINEPILQSWPGNPSEVELVFTVPISTLIQEQTQESTIDPATFDRINQKSKSLSPQYPTSHGTIWGLTAYILQPLIKKLLIPAVYNQSKD